MLMESPTDSGHRAALWMRFRVLKTVRQLLIRNDPVFALFTAYPTQRLLRLLLDATREAKSAVRWLASNPPGMTAADGLNDAYAACCQDLLARVQEWYVLVKLQRLRANLDQVAPETVH